MNGVDFLESLDTEHRVTLIDKEGTVIFDNEADLHYMENHKEREEIKQAKITGRGYSERYSETLSQKTVNVAIRLDDNTILRVSEDLSSIWVIVVESLVPMFILMVIVIIAATYLSYRVSQTITKPINDIDIANPKKEKVYEEIEPLLNKIEEQNKQIARQIEELQIEHERQDNMRRDFTANVSHELKTPLTSISGFAEIIQNGIVKDEDIRRFAGKIHNESQRLIILVGDIIKLSQLEGNDITVKMEPIDLYETSEAVMSHLEDAANRNNVTLKLTGTHSVITGAEQIVEEMIFNLIDNAIKYNKPGGEVCVNIARIDDRIEFSVSDTGIGIPKEDQERIFERFYRVDKNRSKDIGGTGLGLSIVKHGAIFHNAELFVTSEPKIGTTVKMVF